MDDRYETIMDNLDYFFMKAFNQQNWGLIEFFNNEMMYWERDNG